MWAALLEKAYAKMKVNYANLSYGWSHEGFRTLTNMPVGIYTLQEITDDELFTTF